MICDAAEKTNEKGLYMGIPAMTLEILSPSTRSTDLVFKLNSFMMSGVREYWLVDPQNRQITLYRFEDLQIAEYATVRVGETAKSWQFEGLRVALDELWETRG